MKKSYRFLFFLVFFTTMHLSSQAQDLLKGRDLSQVNVDQLTDADVLKLRTQMNSAGLTIEQAEQMALSKGMSTEEFAKLKKRLASINDSSDKNSTVGKLRTPGTDDRRKEGRRINSPDTLDLPSYPQENKRRPLIDSLIFGSELYTAGSPDFQPNLNLATPVNYIIGPTDELSVNVYGIQQYEGSLKVSAEGSIFVPNVGQIKVSGMTIEAATEKIKNAMANGPYPYLKTGGAKLSITLANIRTIRVTVIGSVFPGTINISSLATVYHALYVAGGPSQFGSFREIELVRQGSPVRKIDLYRFLLNGDQSDNIGLKDNDVIRIPPYKVRVQLEGQIKRPGIFEVLPREKFADILAFASGFTDTAYKAGVKVYQRTERERAVLDLAQNQYNEYQPQSGDLFVISKTINRFLNRVKITGAVYRPDVYALTPGLHVADLIRRADGLTEDAYAGRGLVLRLKEDLTRSVISFDISKALAGNDTNNILLLREDEVLVTSVQDLRDTFKVSIQGEVRMPGNYDFVANLTVKDLILQAGGFTDAAHKNIEISRMIGRDSVSMNDFRSAELIITQISGDLQSTTANIPLQPYDVVTVRRKAGYQVPQSVTVSGQMQFPGPYTLNNINERVSSIYFRAGRALPDANLAGAYIKRFRSTTEKELAVETAKNVQRNAKDTSGSIIMDLNRDYDRIPLDLPYILTYPGSTEDIVLKEKDELVVPKFDAQVKISGAVLLPSQIPFQKEYSISDYIAAGGGYAGRAWINKVYIVYPNGKAAVTRKFLFFRNNPKVLPGSEIIVPSKIEKKGMSAAEIIGLSSALASMAGVVIALLRL